MATEIRVIHYNVETCKVLGPNERGNVNADIEPGDGILKRVTKVELGDVVGVCLEDPNEVFARLADTHNVVYVGSQGGCYVGRVWFRNSDDDQKGIALIPPRQIKGVAYNTSL